VQPLGKDVRDLLVLLDQHGVRYLIVGGFAVAVHGTPRYTKDLDIWVDCSPDNAARLATVMDEFGFGSLGLTTTDFSTPDLVIQLGYEPNRIDLLTGLTGVKFDDAYPKRVKGTIDGLELPIIDRESLIANKRAFGRSQDLTDVKDLEP
jgi:predicted nucleotidyltransferase